MNESERDEREREKGRGREHIAVSFLTTIVHYALGSEEVSVCLCVLLPFDYSDNIYLVCPTWFINVSSKQVLFGLPSPDVPHPACFKHFSFP